VRKNGVEEDESRLLRRMWTTALLVSALDGDFNPRRRGSGISRSAWESGARASDRVEPADACEDARVKAVEMSLVSIRT